MNVVLGDPDLNCQGKIFCKVNNTGTVRPSPNTGNYVFYERRYFPSNGIIAHVVLRSFDLHFKGQEFEMSLSRKQ